MSSLLIFIIVAVLIVLYGVSLYNKFVRKRSMMEEGMSGIDVQLKKRYDLIPNLIETVKGYAKHEKETLNQVIEARNNALSAQGVNAQSNAENKLNASLANVFALAEAYPDLKANTQFMELQKELSNIEGDIEKSRRYYNATVRENNIMVESFPSSIIASKFDFYEGEYFELEDASQKALPEVKF